MALVRKIILQSSVDGPGNRIAPLVGSEYYAGNLLKMNTDTPDCIVLHAEANRMEPLLYALRQAFPNLDIEMQETEW